MTRGKEAGEVLRAGDGLRCRRRLERVVRGIVEIEGVFDPALLIGRVVGKFAMGLEVLGAMWVSDDCGVIGSALVIGVN